MTTFQMIKDRRSILLEINYWKRHDISETIEAIIEQQFENVAYYSFIPNGVYRISMEK